MSKGISSNWGWFLAAGILSVLLGVIAIGSAAWTTMVSAIFLGWLFFIGGIFQIIDAFRNREWEGFTLHLLTGILAAAVGLLFIGRPLLGAGTLTLLLAFMLLGSGVYRSIVALMVRFPHWKWVLSGGLLSTLLGLTLLLSWPASGFSFIGFCIGLSLIFQGSMWITLGWTIRNAVKTFAKAA